MSLEEYFGDWIRVINQKELNIVIDAMNRLYGSMYYLEVRLVHFSLILKQEQ